MDRLAAVLLASALAVALTAGGAVAQEKLLTENGLTNAKYNEYKNKPMHMTGGSYTATPGTIETDYKVKDLTFAEGRLTNGDTTYAWKRTPGPYTYWQGKKKGTIVFDFKASYTVTRVRVKVLNSASHGTKSLRFSRSADGKAYEEIKLIEEAISGWNELKDLSTELRYLKIEFELQPKKHHLTCSEVEVWGKPAAKAEPAAKIDPAGTQDAGTIVIAKDAPEVTRFAAKELQACFGKISGGRFGIVTDDRAIKGPRVLIGRSRHTDAMGIKPEFDPEGFIIKRVGNDLVLMGDDRDRPGGPPARPF